MVMYSGIYIYSPLPGQHGLLLTTIIISDIVTGPLLRLKHGHSLFVSQFEFLTERAGYISYISIPWELADV